MENQKVTVEYNKLNKAIKHDGKTVAIAEKVTTTVLVDEGVEYPFRIERQVLYGQTKETSKSQIQTQRAAATEEQAAKDAELAAQEGEVDSF